MFEYTCLSPLIPASKLPNDVTLIFAGYNEPFTNKNCLEFIKLGLEKGHEIRLYTTLFRVSMKTSKQLLKLHKKYKEQFNHIWIHLPDDKGNMPGWKYSDEYVEVLDFFCKNFPANTMTLDSDNQIHSSLKGKFSTNNWYLHTRAGNVNSDNIQNQKYYAPPRYEFFTECTRNKDFTSNVFL